jgi:formylglycine-generating enzyme required for sulfatase activity
MQIKLCLLPIAKISVGIVLAAVGLNCSIPLGHSQRNGNRVGDVQMNVGTQELILVRIPAGKFRMGSSAGEEEERPMHTVTISHDFWMGKYAVTQAQFQAVVGRNPSNWKHPNNPVEQVTWDNVQTFLSKVNAMQNVFKFRLPTEAEWEYACRAGTTAERYGPLKKIAWYGSPFFGRVHPVGQKEPNAFGLYDMLGNASQWCQDWFGPYSAEDQIDPQGPKSGVGRVVRGSVYWSTAQACRAAWRAGYEPGYCYMSLGFRIVAVARMP